MTVLLVLATFVALLAVEYVYSRRRALRPVVLAQEAAAPARLRPEIAAGFEVPANLRYHPGHTWALAESPGLVRAGLDGFAARLIGRAERITMPLRGQWIRQGQPVFKIHRDGETAELVSPVEGMVTGVNESVQSDPALALSDPYGEGWLVTVQAPDAATSFRNLLGGAVALRWMEEAAARLRGRFPALAGAVAQDGGLAVADVTAGMPAGGSWPELTREFFLA
jgi:glycine cleavage system H lipoate-binding protein